MNLETKNDSSKSSVQIGNQKQRALDEILEALWTGLEMGGSRREDLNQVTDFDIKDEHVIELKERHLVKEEQDGTLRFTDKGEEKARSIIRRHRLAERLVHDILGVSMSEVEANACEFEHLVAPGITESICTLLGHPAQCPHGRPIPEGACCTEARKSVEPVVVSAHQMATGEEARVAYINTKNFARLQKLTSFGISPGVRVKLHQRKPAFVLECDQTQLALEEAVAKEIYVFREPLRG
jgi:DtxR family Mn-dependent transcriptional regulator